MAQTNLLELAKQGDPQAIATLMNRSLQPRGMTASVDRQGSCLYVTLQAEQVPNRQVLTAFVQNGISNLGVSSIQLVKISGQQFGMAEPAWTQDLQIDAPDLGDFGLGDPEPAEPTAPPYDAGASLNELDDIAPAPNPVGDILSELTAPPPSPTFEPEVWSPAEPALDLENEFASGDLPPLGDDFSEDFSEDFSLGAIASDDPSSGSLSDDLLADLDLGADLEADLEADLMADFQPDDPGLGLGLSGLDDLESSLSDASLGSDSSEFGQDTGSFDSAFDSAFTDGSFSDTAFDASAPPDAGMQEPSSDALLSDLDALESTQDGSLDEPDEMLSDLGSLEGDLAQIGDDFLEIDTATGESHPGMGLEPDEFDTGLPDLELSGSASDSSFDLTPEVLDFPLTDFDELSPSSVDEPLSEPLSGLEDLDFGDSSPSVPNDAGFDDMGLGDAELDSAEFGNTEFGNTEFGNTELGNTELGNTELGNTEFGNTEFDDASLSDADFDLDLSSTDLLSESPASADLEGAFADLEATGEPAADSGQQEDDFGAIAAGFETEAQFDDLLTDSSTAEFDQSTDFTEPAPPPPAPYVAEEISLDLDLDDIQLPPVTDESGDDWDADLEFGNLTGEDLSDFTADPAEPAETAVEAAAELEALDRGSAFGASELPSGDWEAAAATEESSGFDATLELGSSPVPLPADFAESAAATPISAPAGDAAPWLSDLPPEFVIDVTLNDSLPESAGVERLGSEGTGAIALESTKLAQDLDLEAQDLYFDSVADRIAPESPPAAVSSNFDFDLDNLDGLDDSSNSGSPDRLPDADLFDETSDIPLSQLPTEIPSSEIRDDEPDTPDFLDMPLSGLEVDEAVFNSPYDNSPDSFPDSSPENEFTLEDETAPTELMSAIEEALPSELLVDDLDASGGFEMDNLGLGLDSLEREDFQPSAPEASSGEDFGLGGLEEFDLDAPAADWQNESEPLPETTFGLDDEDETTILLDPAADPGASFGAASPSSELDREELDWLVNEVSASANPPVSPLSSAEEGWSYGIPPAPPPPEDTFAYPASAPQTPDQAAVEAGEPEAEVGAESGGRATNLLYGVLLALLAWILALIGRSLWTELTQPEPPPAPPVEVSPQSQEPERRSPFSSFS